MFRRAYAVVFYYRYENAELCALSQQLDHKDLEMTLHYVLDGKNRDIERAASTLWADQGRSRSARAEHARELAKEVDEYGATKFQDDILEILTNPQSSRGGFKRLVERFARRMFGRVVYDDNALRLKAAQSVSAAFLERGHSLRPFPHGNCNAGPPKRSAGCYDNNQLARENASPIVCSHCPYHSLKQAHVESIRQDLVRQEAALESLPVNVIRYKVLNQEIEVTRKLIKHYEEGR